MGYTHYYELPANEITDAVWDKFTSDVNELLVKPYVALGDGWGNEGSSPDVNNHFISLNGIGDNAHETLHINRNDHDFSFTKTARKRYDRIVVAILTLAHNQLGMEVTSDGYKSEWKTGVRYLNKTLGTSFDIPETIHTPNQKFK